MFKLPSPDGYQKSAMKDVSGRSTVTYCGPFVRMSETPLSGRRRPRLIGEHNLEIYGGELKMPKETLAALESAGTI